MRRNSPTPFLDVSALTLHDGILVLRHQPMQLSSPPTRRLSSDYSTTSIPLISRYSLFRITLQSHEGRHRTGACLPRKWCFRFSFFCLPTLENDLAGGRCFSGGSVFQLFFPQRFTFASNLVGNVVSGEYKYSNPLFPPAASKAFPERRTRGFFVTTTRLPLFNATVVADTG